MAKMSSFSNDKQRLSSADSSLDSNELFFTHGEETEAKPLEKTYSRTSLIILDYYQFKAARRIQACWRAYHGRLMFQRYRWAALHIQRWWRGFYVRKNFYRTVENMLQTRIMAHYNRAATKIQALWRGYWTRQNVHDMHSLRNMQICAAEDLLHCVAAKLHHLMRTRSIPGVYSIRNSQCLSRVEKLLASMSFRFYNHRVASKMVTHNAQEDFQRQRYKKSYIQTEVPYKGPNFTGYCLPSCEENLKQSKDIDRRMYKIIALYEESQRGQKKVHRNLAEKKRLKYLQETLQRIEENKRDFCGDVIESMRKWKILEGTKCTVNKDIFRTPENVENFLDEIAECVGELDTVRCHCRIDPAVENTCV